MGVDLWSMIAWGKPYTGRFADGKPGNISVLFAAAAEQRGRSSV
jgi:hypothetical protein